MKKFILTIGLFSFFFLAFSQEGLKVTTMKLQNGLTVYLNEDHNNPSVFGAVIVKGGSKRDPRDATGIAHYFEHIMFKGTDKLGTIDYQSEKVYLDSISYMYDSLGKTKDDDIRKKIQLKINDLSLKAGDFAIPNELDKLIEEIGGTKLNAFTSEDEIAYFNQFPPEFINQWIEIYSDRFISPVFRLFQSELETVYEEKNMYADNPGSAFYDKLLKTVFPTTPYGEQVIGETAHLKNPSLSKMKEYFDNFYVANNMALVLVGNFKTEDILPVIEEKFGRWRSGEVPQYAFLPEQPFKGREFHKARMLPIPVGVIAYRGVPQGHEDEIALDVCMEIMNNSASTGLLDKLYLDNKLMAANINTMSYIEDGALMVMFAPKILRQSLKSAEKMVMNEIEKVKKGEFSDTLLNTVKYMMKKRFEQGFEGLFGRAFMINDIFLQDKTWEEYIRYPEMIDRIGKEDIIRIANKYLTDNRMVYYSKTGFPKKEKLKKPPYKPIVPKNSEQKSDYFKMIENMPAKKVEPLFIHMGKDVMFKDLTDKIHLYYTPNPYNSIFSMDISFGVGTDKMPMLNYAASFMSLLGTTERSFEEFSRQMQAIGSTYSIYASGTDFSIYVTGFDENFDKTMILIDELINKMKGEKKHLEKFIDNEKADRRFFKADPAYIAEALSSYVLYKENSPYLTKLSLKEVKKLKMDTLLATLKQAMNYEVELCYAGKLPMETVESSVINNLHFRESLLPTLSMEEKPRKLPKENTVFYVPEKNAIQSQIEFFSEGSPQDNFSRVYSYPFNKYFGSGMASLVFQEIREFRSLSYSAYGYYSGSYFNGRNGHFSGGMSTQSDKTIEGINVYLHLLDSMPDKPERVEKIIQSLERSFNDNRGSFRYLAGSVAIWRKQGFEDDPRINYYPQWQVLKYDDIRNFYIKNLFGKPRIIAIVTDPSRVKEEDLKKFGVLIKLDKKDIYVK